MRKSTPGPWSVASGNEGEVEVRATRKWPIAIVLTGSDDLDVLDDPETRANARLIAAAPDMLAVLTMYVEQNPPKGTTFKQWVRSNARAAIAKAQGAAQ